MPNPVGNMYWYDENNNQIGYAQVDGSGSPVSCTVSNLAAGIDTVSAVYVPTDGSNASQASLDQTVNQGSKNTVTTIASSKNPSNVGDSVTFTSTVAFSS